MKNLLKISNGVNKIFLSIILIVLLGIVLMPNLAVAQVAGGPNDCCELKHNISWDGQNFKKDDLVGGTGDDIICDFTNDGLNDVRYILSPHSDDWPIICLTDTIMTITDWIFYALLLVSVAMILISAFLFVISTGDPGRTETAKKMIIYAVVGLIVAIFAKLIPSIVKFILGM